jgi:Fungalysin/Thermolysin Propeptide Motif./Fungalysin metallopeptidase (M36).
MKRAVASFATLLFASAALARDLPNFDAAATARVAPSDVVRAAATRAAGGAKIPTEWYGQYGAPSFLWIGGAAGDAAASKAAVAAFGGLDGAYVSEVHDTGRGAIVTRYRQRIDGIEVFRNELNVVTARDGTTVAISGHLAGGVATAVRAAYAKASSPFRLSSTEAVTIALRDFGAGSASDARVTLAWFDLGASLEPAYSIELEADGDMFAYVISATDGRLLYRKNLTEDAGTPFTYRVWADASGARRPLNGPQGFAGDPSPTGVNDGFQATLTQSGLVTLANGPISTGDPWLAPTATQSTGNNVDAYADLSAPDGFSIGDERAAITGPNTFDYGVDLLTQPGVNSTQRRGAVTQLFYDVNFLHDWFYDSGFNEAARNAQNDNYGRGGAGGDAIRAEAQDYFGRNNANMSVPSDGNRPRMQMYLWDAVTFRALDVDAPASIAGRYGVGTAVFGPQTFTVSGDVVTTSPADGCTAISSLLTGKIAFVNRGSCNFTVKARNAQAAGALALIVGNVAGSPSPSSYSGMACDSATCTPPEITLVPSLQIPLESANAFRARLAAGTVHATLRRDAGIDRDGTIDNSIVAHEWGHYLSNRLIANSAGLTSNQSRGMGEGWSDFVALLLMVRAEDTAIASNATFTGVFPMAGFVTSGGANGPDPNGGYYFGIRRVPYSTDMTRDPLTLRHVSNGVPITGAPVASGADGGNNAEVHRTGEVWATMLWECYAALLRDTLGTQPRLTFAEAQQRMKDYLVASLKITPVDPTFLDARDALLAAAFANDRTDFLRFWQAFAKRGAGTRAIVTERYSTANAGVAEDFTLGADASITSITLDDSASTCKKNGVLEGGEEGLITVTIRNSGNAHLAATTGHVTSDDPRLHIDGGGVLTFPASDPAENVSAALHVSLAPGTDAITATVNVTVSDPDFALVDRATFTSRVRLNAHDESKQSTSDDFESPRTAWTAPANARWIAVELSSTQHVWQGVERFNQTDASLVSPVLTVTLDRPLRIVFRHRHWFDTATGSIGDLIALDGGVVELSSDGGSTWTDIGSTAAPGYGPVAIVAGNSNPLEGRRAFIGNSPGASLETPSTSPFTTSIIDLGTTYAGRRVRIRFRIGTGVGHTGAPLLGWQIDDVVVNGITNLPFYALIADRGLCGTAASTTELRAIGAAGSQLTVQATVSSPLATPNGTVEFLENGQVIGAVPAVNGVATWNPSTFLGPGSHTITASFVGTVNFAPSSSATVTITIAPPSRRRAAR